MLCILFCCIMHGHKVSCACHGQCNSPNIQACNQACIFIQFICIAVWIEQLLHRPKSIVGSHTFVQSPDWNNRLLDVWQTNTKNEVYGICKAFGACKGLVTVDLVTVFLGNVGKVMEQMKRYLNWFGQNIRFLAKWERCWCRNSSCVWNHLYCYVFLTLVCKISGAGVKINIFIQCATVSPAPRMHSTTSIHTRCFMQCIFDLESIFFLTKESLNCTVVCSGGLSWMKKR